MNETHTESGADEIILVVETNSARETKAWGRRLASLLEGGELLGFTGELGGKGRRQSGRRSRLRQNLGEQEDVGGSRPR